MPIDYSKFDNLETDSEGDEPAAAGKGGGAYTDQQRKQFEEAAARAQQAQAPTAGDDPRGEIERLKAERRAKREAEAVKEASSGAPPPPSDSAAADDVKAEDAGEEGPLSQLTAAERLADTIRADIASVEASLANFTVYDASLMQTCVKINGGVGKLQNDLDGKGKKGREGSGWGGLFKK